MRSTTARVIAAVVVIILASGVLAAEMRWFSMPMGGTVDTTAKNQELPIDTTRNIATGVLEKADNDPAGFLKHPPHIQGPLDREALQALLDNYMPESFHADSARLESEQETDDHKVEILFYLEERRQELDTIKLEAELKKRWEEERDSEKSLHRSFHEIAELWRGEISDIREEIADLEKRLGATDRDKIVAKYRKEVTEMERLQSLLDQAKVKAKAILYAACKPQGEAHPTKK